jgi:hypothetical protein
MLMRLRPAKARVYAVGLTKHRRKASADSAEIEDDHAAFDVVFTGLGLRRRVIHVYRQLEAGAIELLSTLDVFFPPPDLIDNERRKHRSSPRFLSGLAPGILFNCSHD